MTMDTEGNIIKLGIIWRDMKIIIRFDYLTLKIDDVIVYELTILVC